MNYFTEPEISRVPLTEICLYAKVLAEVSSIENFLKEALDPPPEKNIRKSIDLLKKIKALDAQEVIQILESIWSICQ